MSTALKVFFENTKTCITKVYRKTRKNGKHEGLALLRRDTPALDNVALVPDENLVHIDVSVHLDLGHPVSNRQKRLPVSHVIDEEDALGAAKVRGCDCAEAFLACGIPNLQLDAFAVQLNILDLEVDSDRRDKRRRK
jgi:hypothetical protein